MLKAAITLGLVLGLAAPVLAKAPSKDLGGSRPGASEVAKKKKKKDDEKKDGEGGAPPPPEAPAPQY